MTQDSPMTELEHAAGQLDLALEELAAAHEQDPYAPVFGVLEATARLVDLPGGFDALYARVARIERARVFAGSDWDYPALLSADMAWQSLRLGTREVTLVEILNEVRLVAVAAGDYAHPDIHPEHAERLLRRIMALNLDLLGGELGEADRNRPDRLGFRVQALFRFLLERLGSEHLLEELAAETWRMLAERPVRVETIKYMITRLAIGLGEPGVSARDADGRAARLVEALFTPSPGTQGDPGLERYRERLAAMDYDGLVEEARSMGQAMCETGLVSPYHPLLIQQLRRGHEELLLTALGLSSTGCDALLSYRQLVAALIDAAIFPETSQAVHGLAMLLERALLHSPGVAAGLWRQLHSPPCDAVAQRVALGFGSAHPAQAFLLGDLLAVLGQPLGVGQGNHPTCQSARALSMWALAEPRRLLDLFYQVTRDDDLVMRFETEWLSSAELPAGPSEAYMADVDAVSLAMVPHLDRIYWEMGRRCAQRGGDPHQWVNPEFHGDGVFRGFRIAVDVASGMLEDPAGFVRDFHAVYHPYYNGDVPLVHPQPAGIAVTDRLGRFLGWHAISIQRLALDQQGSMRVYFFNPNNDSAQDWGQGIVTSTRGRGELPGESSLPVAQFVARLYAFHYDPRARGRPEAVSSEEIDTICCEIRKSWGAGR